MDTGRLHRWFRGVYSVGHRAETELAWERAALLACGPTATLALDSALFLWGLLPQAPRNVQLIVPGRRCRAQHGLEPHSGGLAAGEVRRLRGLRVTAPLRTLLDVSVRTQLERLEPLVNEARARRLVFARELRASSSPRLRELGLVRGFVRSRAEALLRDLIRRAGLRPTGWNEQIGNWNVDALFTEQRVVVEVDSFSCHGTRVAFERDRRKDLELTAAGYRVIRVTWRQIVERPESLVAQLVRILG